MSDNPVPHTFVPDGLPGPEEGEEELQTGGAKLGLGLTLF